MVDIYKNILYLSYIKIIVSSILGVFFMNKILFNFSTIVSFLSLSVPMLAMDPQEQFGYPCSSVAIRGEISAVLKKQMFNSFEDAFNNINGAQNKNSVLYKWNGTKVCNQFRHQTLDKASFKYSHPNSYHVSLSIIHPPEKGRFANQLIEKDQQAVFCGLANTHLQPGTLIQVTQNVGNCFQFLTMVHSYDTQGDQINKTYYNTLGNLSADFPQGISNVHFAMRHGTMGVVKHKIETGLNVAINAQEECFKNPYKGKFDEFIGHITLGKMDKSNGGVIDASSTRFRPEEYSIVFDVHKVLKEAFDQDKAKFNTKGTVPFERISMRGLVFEKGKCTGDILLKNDISK